MRRRFLLLVAAAFISATTFFSFGDAPKYIFYFIGDGMGMAPVMAAATYNRSVLGTAELPLMMTFPVAGQVMTFSASSDVTDSAAAGTALATGNKTVNGMLGVTPDTTAVYSVASILKDKLGYGVGIVTNVAADDATPGAFYAHVAHRSMSKDIDRQFAESKVDFLAGASLNGLYDKEGNSTGVPELFAKNNVRLVNTVEEIGDGNERIALIEKTPFSKSNVGYVNDSIPGKLTLPAMTQACLDYLVRKSPDGFFMMVEGGNIDHALHANDGGAALKEILNFDQSLALAYDFYLRHPDETLIVVTADHDTGGMAMIAPSGAKGGLGNIDFQKVSKEEFSDYCKSILRSRMVYRWEDMREYLADNLGFFTHIRLDEKQEESLHALFDKTFGLRNSADQQTLYASFNEFAVEVFRIFNDAAGLAFTTTSHSGNAVPVFAVGVGAERLKGFNNNVDIPRAILDTVRASDSAR